MVQVDAQHVKVDPLPDGLRYTLPATAARAARTWHYFLGWVFLVFAVVCTSYAVTHEAWRLLVLAAIDMIMAGVSFVLAALAARKSFHVEVTDLYLRYVVQLGTRRLHTARRLDELDRLEVRKEAVTLRDLSRPNAKRIEMASLLAHFVSGKPVVLGSLMPLEDAIVLAGELAAACNAARQVEEEPDTVHDVRVVA